MVTELPHYDEIHQLAVDLVNASEGDDSRLQWSLYEQLEKLCQGQTHPFPWETLAYFTSDDRAALKLYGMALGHAENLALDDYIASIQLAVAERYRELGESALAFEHASTADQVARKGGDLELRQAISEFLLGETSNAR